MRPIGIALATAGLTALLGGASLGCSSGSATTSASAVASASSSAKADSSAQPIGLAVGSPAPNVTFTFADGTTAALSSFKGQLVLVYFYPQDDTPGCTMEAQGIHDAWSDFVAAGVKVIGVSMQDAASHKAFSDKLGLQFPLAVDVDGTLAKEFHVPFRGKNARRQSYLIGKDGNVLAAWEKVDPSTHAAEVLKAASAK